MGVRVGGRKINVTGRRNQWGEKNGNKPGRKQIDWTIAGNVEHEIH